MRKSAFILALVAMFALAGCSSLKVLDTETSVPSSQFKTHKAVKKAYERLEKDIETYEYVTRFRVHKDGFDPVNTDISIIDYIRIIDKFTANGNEVAADLGIKPPAPVLFCLKDGKKCTAYRVIIQERIKKEIPEGKFGVLKSAMDLEEVNHTTVWKFQFIVVFHGDQAVYTQVEEDIAPTTTVDKEKNSIWKKMFRWGRKATDWP